MDAVNAALLDAMRAHFLAEARRIARQRLRKLALVENRIDEFADHRMLGGADQIQILALDLVHHVLHFGKGHDAVDDVRTDHKRRDIIGESAIDHEIARIGQDCRMQTRNIALQIIEAVSAGAARGIEIDAVQALHDVDMVRNLPFGHDRLSEALVFNVFAVVLADRNGGIDDLRNHEHTLANLGGVFFLILFQLRQLVLHLLDLRLDLLGFLALTFRHHAADLLAQLVALRTQVIRALNCLAVLLVQLQHLVDQRKLCVLELLFDVLADQIRVRADQIDIQHIESPPLLSCKKEKSPSSHSNPGRRTPRCHPACRALRDRSKRFKGRDASDSSPECSESGNHRCAPPDFHPYPALSRTRRCNGIFPQTQFVGLQSL